VDTGELKDLPSVAAVEKVTAKVIQFHKMLKPEQAKAESKKFIEKAKTWKRGGPKKTSAPKARKPEKVSPKNSDWPTEADVPEWMKPKKRNLPLIGQFVLNFADREVWKWERRLRKVFDAIKPYIEGTEETEFITYKRRTILADRLRALAALVAEAEKTLRPPVSNGTEVNKSWSEKEMGPLQRAH